MMKKLENDIEEAKHENYDSVLIYYTGHGESEFGGWVTYSGEDNSGSGDLSVDGCRIKITEVLDKIKEIGYNKNLEITTDACFSGKGAYLAKEWWE